jgi:predicted Rossmann-fold nucleotide-binding protein
VIKGEEVRCIVDYNLFDNEIRDMIGMYIRTNPDTNKHLIYFRDIGEWGELLDEEIQLVNDGFVSHENKEIAETIRELRITCDY